MDNNISKIIGNRINTLLAEHGVKQKELAQHLQIPDNTISYFVKGTRVPNTNQIIKIAQYFNVSSDYLLGLSPAESNDRDVQFLSKYTGLSDTAIEVLHSTCNADELLERKFDEVAVINLILESESLLNLIREYLNIDFTIKKEGFLIAEDGRMYLADNNGLEALFNQTNGFTIDYISQNDIVERIMLDKIIKALKQLKKGD